MNDKTYSYMKWCHIYSELFVRFRHPTFWRLFAFVITISIVGFDHVQAGSLYKWIDENGNVIYQDTPPPSSVKYEEQTYKEQNSDLREEVSRRLDVAAEESPISFYSVPNCDTCDLIRFYLEKKSLPFAEKDVQNNVTLQQELQSRAGQLNVPILIVGDEVIDGYSKSAMRKVLIEKGYPLDDIDNNQIQSSGQPNDLSQHDVNDQQPESNDGDPLAELEALEAEVTFDDLVEIENGGEPNSEIQDGSN